MHISLEVKKWLQDNAVWLDELNFDDGRDIEKVFKKIPTRLFTEIYRIFKAAGIELLDNNSGDMYGIKSSDGYTTLSLGKHNKTNFNINFTASQGMKGGHQIGFKSISDAIDFIENINNTLGVDQDLRPSKMQPNIVSQYNWVEVDTVYGKCMVTTLAFDKYDPTSAAKNRLLKKANKEAAIKIIKYMEPICKDIYDALESRFGTIATHYIHPEVSVIDTHIDHHIQELHILNFAIADDAIPEVIKMIKRISGLDVKVTSKYVPTFDNKEKWTTSIWLDISSNKFYKDIRDEFYAKYGIIP